MAANVYQPHLLLLIEDDANRQIFNGFSEHPGLASRRIQMSKLAGGWLKVLEDFKTHHIALLRKFPHRHLLMVIDFDSDDAEPSICDAASRINRRRALFTGAIPEDLRARVFVIGCADEPEGLARATGCKFEENGRLLAEDCEFGTDKMWGHSMLGHNAKEIARLRDKVRAVLFV